MRENGGWNVVEEYLIRKEEGKHNQGRSAGCDKRCWRTERKKMREVVREPKGDEAKY
jgi:hypothetical protein